MLTKVFTATLHGIDAIPIKVEVDAYTPGMQPRFTIVGLPDNAVKESFERIRSALRSNGIKTGPKSIVVNLSPADIKKEGSGFDLPIALGLMIACECIRVDTDFVAESMFVGELGLDGSLLPVKGALPVAVKARALGYKYLFVPKENVREAAVVDTLKVFGVENIRQIIDFLQGYDVLEPTEVNTRAEFFENQDMYDCDFDEVKGQENVKRAFEIAAAGGHNVILVGSPGCGKSMMAKRLPTILPPLSLYESFETTQIQSIAGILPKGSSLVTTRPFRSPHHTISDVGLVGGGNTFMPGEICLSHNGILFLDELPEFSRGVLETMRQPLEDRVITVSRSRYSLTLPCSFMLVASMNPCPCGYLHNPTHQCVCSPGQVQRYMNKISGPLMDRIDIQVEVASVPFEDIALAPKGESSATIRERVIAARKIQSERFKNNKGIHCNAQMTKALMEKYASLDAECTNLLRDAMKSRNLSARAYDRIIKVARTIADLEGAENIGHDHIAEAVGYRNMDRDNWIE